MTTNQKTLYWRLWAAAFRTNWRVCKGQALPISDLCSPWVQEIEAVCVRRCGRMTADDLRHSSHVVALGRDVSSNAMTNSDVDRVFSLFRLMADPDDLSALVNYENPERGQRARLEWALVRSAPDAYVRKVCRGKFDTECLANLDTVQLSQLLMTIKSRVSAMRPELHAEAHN